MIRDVAANPSSGGGRFDFSQTGMFVYAAGKGDAAHFPIGWMREGGKVEPFPLPEAAYGMPRISPDGSHVALTNASNGDLWIYEMERGTLARLTSTGNGNRAAVWTPDGKHIAYACNSPNGYELWWTRSDGSAAPVRLAQGKQSVVPSSFSPDGRTLAEYDLFLGGIALLHLDLTDPDRPKALSTEPWQNGSNPVYSADGRWVAYTSADSGAQEIYVRPAPGNHTASGRWTISTAGGRFPSWSAAGRRIFYCTPDNHIMVADYTVTGENFVPGKPRLWSETPIGNATGTLNYDVAPDGKRVLATPGTEAPEANGNLHLTFLFNFFDELKRRMP